MPALKTISASANTPIYQSVSLVRTVSSMAFLLTSNEHIALTAQRPNKLQPVAIINFAPQPLNVNLDQVRKRIKIFVPHMLTNLGAADDLASTPRHVFQ